MCRSTILGWIEEAEAARVLIDAAFDRPPPPRRCGAVAKTAAGWCDRVRRRLSPPAFGAPVWQLAQVRIAASRRRPANEGRDYGCCW